MSAVARSRTEILGGDVFVEFSCEISVEELTKVGESVVGHVNSVPSEVVFGFELFDDHPYWVQAWERPMTK